MLLSQFDIRYNGSWLEHHTVIVRAYVRTVNLLRKVGDVVGEPKEVLLVCAGTGLARHSNSLRLGRTTNAAQSLNAQHVLTSDAIEEDDAAIDLEVVCSLG